MIDLTLTPEQAACLISSSYKLTDAEIAAVEGSA